MFLAEEARLQILHVLADRLLGILLHTRVEGGIDTQSVLIEVVMRAVGFGVLLAEAVQRVIVPLIAVDLVLQLVPLGVVALLGLLGSKCESQELAEIRSQTLLVIDRVVLDLHGHSG